MVPVPRIPPRGPHGRLFPRFKRYYQGTVTSCRPSRRTSFPSFGGTTRTRHFAPAAVACVRRRAWGWSPGIPVRVFFRGDDRISQVPGEPQFPFAHGLRPRPANLPQTNYEVIMWSPLLRRRGHRRLGWFRGSIAWLSGSLSTYRVTVTRLTAQDSLPGAGQALLGRL